MQQRRSCLRLLLALAVLVGAQLAAAKITTEEIRRDDRQLILMAEPFGFGGDGRINITLTKFRPLSLWDASKGAAVKLHLNRMGFFITTAEAETQLVEVDGCPLDSTDYAVTLFTLDEVDAASGEVSRGYALNELLLDYSGGEFSLFFVNCEPHSAVDFDARVALFNAKAGGRLDFLPLGEDMLPLMYLIMFVLFTALGFIWVRLLRKGKENAHKIHYLMAAQVAAKTLTVLSQAGMFHAIAVYGDAEGWFVPYYVFSVLRGAGFFLVVVLIATGWSFMKPFLAERERNIIMAVLALQVINDAALLIVDEYTPAARSWFAWQDILHLVDIVCCCAVLFPVVWHIKHLRDASESDGKAARSLAKLVLFRQFYIMVVSYIYFTRIIVILLQATLPFRLIWLAPAAQELATLAFYLACGALFRPLPAGANPYFALDSDEIELAA